VTVLFDEPALAQGSQMTAHRGEGEARGFGELARAAGPLAEQVHDAPPVGVRQSYESPIQAFFVHSLSE
jgi:hypothetical protein